MVINNINLFNFHSFHLPGAFTLFVFNIFVTVALNQQLNAFKEVTIDSEMQRSIVLIIDCINVFPSAYKEAQGLFISIFSSDVHRCKTSVVP
jgi:hypothetical protein